MCVSEGVSAGDLDDLTGEHTGLLAGKEKDGFGNVFGLDELTHRDERKDGLLQVLVYPACLGGSGSDTVHRDSVFCHFKGDTAGQSF